ncbi:MAG: class 1 fructose-bisphosphatase [Roseiarcus sp.]
MLESIALERYLAEAARPGPLLAAACESIARLADAAREISGVVGLGALAGDMGETVGVNADGDAQKALDLRAQEILADALRRAPVAAIASEELEDWDLLDAERPVAVAFDPLDGSSSIGANLAIGTIFSILPAKGANNPFIGRGSAQLAAGFFLYGPQTTLVLTLGAGVDVFTLDRRDQTWRLTRARAMIPSGTPEFAINVSNYRHWEEPVRVYIDDCLNGSDGPREKNFNMRWLGALVAEASRILAGGGVYLYPADQRPNFREGRLRLVYEAHPIAFIVEQAGGKASTGRGRVLDVVASSLHQRAPLIFGSAEKVALIERLHAAPGGRADQSPLFGRRGLFRS